MGMPKGNTGSLFFLVARVVAHEHYSCDTVPYSNVHYLLPCPGGALDTRRLTPVFATEQFDMPNEETQLGWNRATCIRVTL